MRARLLDLIAPPLCVACGAHAGPAAPLCPGCRARMRPLPTGGGWLQAVFAYEGPAGALVRALKFGGRAALADAMAAQMAANAAASMLRGVLVPVPVHAAHRRRRGVDHTRALAHALAVRAGLPLCECLVRAGDPRPQVGRARAERIAGPAGAFVLCAEPPPRALLVDDVVTTGATLAACSAALHSGGCTQIAALVYARTGAR